MDSFMTGSGILLCGLSLVFFGLTALGSYVLYLGWTYRDVTCSTNIALWTQVHGGTILALGVVGFILVIISIIFLLKSTYGKVESEGWRGWLWTSGLCFPVILLGVGTVAAMLPMLIWGTVLIFGDDLWQKMKSSTGGNQPCDPRLYWPAAIYNIAMWVGGYGLFLVVCCVGLCVLICCFTCCDSKPANNGRRGNKGTGGARGGRAAYYGAALRQRNKSRFEAPDPSYPWEESSGGYVPVETSEDGAQSGGQGASGGAGGAMSIDMGTLTSKTDATSAAAGEGSGQVRTESGILAPDDAAHIKGLATRMG